MPRAFDSGLMLRFIADSEIALAPGLEESSSSRTAFGGSHAQLPMAPSPRVGAPKLKQLQGVLTFRSAADRAGAAEDQDGAEAEEPADPRVEAVLKAMQARESP